MNVETSKNMKYHKIQYITVEMIMAMYKYTCTLIYNYPFTQHTHIIYAQKFNIISLIYLVNIKTCHLKEHKISHS